ncbi:MAG: hypothetical protein WA136_04240 [Rhodoferax sp.]
MLLWGLRTVRGQNLNAFFLACYLGLFMGAQQAGPGTIAGLCRVAVVLVAIAAWAAALRRARAIANMATSRVGSAAQGYVEVQGRASVSPDNLITSPLSGVQCIWYRYRVYEKDAAEREWREVDRGVSSATFEIADATGACRVDPDHAEIMGAETRTTYQDGYKHVEELLFGGRTVYVLGEFSTIGGAATALNLSEDVGALLATWKADAAGLKRRFDLDGNGQIDSREWELARRLAIRTVERNHQDIRQQPGIHMVRAPRDARLFLISALPPQRLRRRYLAWSVFHLGIGLLAAAQPGRALFPL